MLFVDVMSSQHYVQTTSLCYLSLQQTILVDRSNSRNQTVQNKQGCKEEENKIVGIIKTAILDRVIEQSECESK